MELVLKELCSKIEIIQFVGDPKNIVSEMKILGADILDSSSLFWCSDKNRNMLIDVSNGTGIISFQTYEFLQSRNLLKKLNWIVVKQPRLTFSIILKLFFIKKDKFGFIADSAHIHPTVKLDKTKVIIGHNVVIEQNTTIGDYVQIGANTVIKNNTKIGNQVKIGSNNTIGGIGFGYEENENGEFDLIPHIGNVILSEKVEIGNNTCIDRAVMGSTILNENVKVDNLVHIAHGVKIGKNSVIIANAMIAGSVIIGENVWVSPSSSIIQKVNIGDNSLIGMGSVVIKTVEESIIVAGVPAKKIKSK